MNLKKIGKVFTSKFVGSGPSSYKKRIYRATVSQRLGNTDVEGRILTASLSFLHELRISVLKHRSRAKNLIFAADVWYIFFLKRFQILSKIKRWSLCYFAPSFLCRCPLLYFAQKHNSSLQLYLCY